jgi:tetratricopeptide (TPR) repeat protein
MAQHKLLKNLVVIVFLFCCARRFEVSTVKPPELDISGVRHLIIGELYGTGAKDVQSDLQTALRASGSSLLFPDAVRSALESKGLREEVSIDQTLLPLLHQNFQASALLVGHIDKYQVDQAIETRQELDYDEIGILRTYNLTRRHVWVQVEATFQLFDCQSGRVVALRIAKSKIEAATDETRYINSKLEAPPIPPKIDERVLFAKARQQVVSAAVHAVAPHIEIEKVTLYTQTRQPDMAKGISLAKQNQWDAAVELFSSVAKEEPDNDKAFYNLGVAYKYNNQPKEALKALQKAHKLKPSEKYQQEIKRCQKLLEES